MHRRALQSGWLSLLQLPLTQDQYKRTLLIAHSRIISHMPNPILLMDFLKDKFVVEKVHTFDLYYLLTRVFENTGQGTTRTQGFWATHPSWRTSPGSAGLPTATPSRGSRRCSRKGCTRRGGW